MLIGNNISFSCLRGLSSQDKFDTPQPLPFLSVRPATYLSACPSILPCLCWQFHQPLLSVHLSVHPTVCPALAVLTAPWSHAVAVFCSVMATGATPALSQPMDRQPFSLTLFFLKFSFPSKVYFTHFLTCCSTLFFCHLSPSPSSSHSWPSCCWEADRMRDLERQKDRKRTIPWRALLRKSARQAQSVFSLLSMSPMLRLHLDTMPASNDVPSETKEPQTNSSRLLKHKRGTQNNRELDIFIWIIYQLPT